MRDLTGHRARVASLAWNGGSSSGGGGGQWLSSGGRDSQILNHDLRQRRSVVSAFVAHTQEVCGLAWSPDGATLASGGNENLLCLWDAAASAAAATASSSSSGGGSNGAGTAVRPRATFTEHVAAVKAIAWCPWQRHTLATGGGTADRTIRLWNAAVGTNLRSVDTGSQVGRERRARRHMRTVLSLLATPPC